MDLIVTLLIVAVAVGVVYWILNSIPLPPPLQWLRWAVPLLIVLIAVIYFLQQAPHLKLG